MSNRICLFTVSGWDNEETEPWWMITERPTIRIPCDFRPDKNENLYSYIKSYGFYETDMKNWINWYKIKRFAFYSNR